MSRFRKKKKQTKLDEALSTARQNKKKLATAVEIQQGTVLTSTDAFNATPVVDYIAPIGNGTKTRLTSVRVRGTIKRNAASDLIDDYRLDLVLDRMPDETEVTPLELYASATPVIGVFKNPLFKSRFKILRSAKGVFGEGGNGVGGIFIDWYVKLNLIAESSTDNSFAQADIIKNALYLVYWTTAAANQPIPNLNSIVNCMDS